MFIVSNLLGSTIQITTLPLPVLSTLQASGLVFNSICATLILGEPFTTWSLAGTVLVCTGAVLIAIFGAIPEPAHNLDQLLDLLWQRPFVTWVIGQAVLVIFVVVIAGGLGRFPKLSSSPRMRLLRGLVYGFISGILSAHSLLVAKSAVELLVRTIVDRRNQFNRWQSWAILSSLILLALAQLYYLHRGLKLVSTSVLYPLVFCIYNIIAILDGLIYFRQTDKLSALRAGLIALGTVVLLSGVLALSWRLSDEQTQPAVAQSALAPGLGFIEDTDNEEYDEAVTPDEEAIISAEYERLQNGEPMTPTTKFDTVLGATRNVRRAVRVREADEIWNELDDDAKASPPRPPPRSTSMRSEVVTELEGGAEMPTESTSLLHSSTFQRRRRRRSTGFPGFTARPSPRSSRRKSVELQPAMGGFWKMSWWRDKRGKEPPDDEGNEGGPSGGVAT
jgi:magnesium transporter